jgi:small nuclear ribonucleoprotein E
MADRKKKAMLQPINLMFRLLQQKARVQIWLQDNTDMRLEGNMLGFDEFMNIVLDNAEEVPQKEGEPRRKVGRIMLKGENICLMQQAS